MRASVDNLHRSGTHVADNIGKQSDLIETIGGDDTRLRDALSSVEAALHAHDGALEKLTAAMLDSHYAVNTRSSILLVQE